ncbi:DUF2147 domain-containing protein [Sphingomonas abietis]|uniref:DUF2147 domain-containing protein n=1 Tax=Sphingomonas abietis TaxID=3012344 RepID=A0ABY7NPR2_9SPHN|nr:DUF2147 domain-containing protein [Sphingomonas abietis]WBO23192.1 DUF2147 domain-containing protein [Sphingomonas abietis]
MIRVTGWLAAGVALLALATSASAYAPATPAGRWLTEDGKAVVEIMPCGAALCGAILRILKRDPDAPRTDIHNADPRLRQRPMDNLTILSGFVPDRSRWRGQVYDPRSGRTYKSFVDVRPDGTLVLTGCIWMLCQTQTWQRVR